MLNRIHNFMSKSQPGPDPRFNKVNDEVNQRLDTFIEGNPGLKGYYTEMVQKQPDRAIRNLLLNRMFRSEAETRIAKSLTPGAQEWLEKQSPEVQQRVQERVARFSPTERERAFVDVVAEEKAKFDFSQKPSNGQGQSIGG